MSSKNEEGDQVLMEGWLLKKPSHPQLISSKYWNNRYFVLHGSTLSYYMKQGELAEKGSFNLDPGCTISEIFLVEYKDKKGHNGHHHSKINEDIDDQHFDTIGNHKEGNRYIKKLKDSKNKDYKYCIKITWPVEEDPKSSSAALKNKNDVATTQSSPVKGYSSAFEINQKGISKKSPQNSRRNSLKNIHHSPKQTSKKNMTSDLIMPSINDERNQIFRRTEDNQASLEHDHPSQLINLQTDINRQYYSEQAQQQILLNRNTEETLKALARAQKRANSRKTKKKMMQGGSILAATTGAVMTAILTAGSGVIAGLILVGIGAAAGGSGAVVTKSYYKNRNGNSLVLAASNNQEAEMWKAALEDAIRCGAIENSLWASIFAGDGRSPAEFLLPTSKVIRNESANDGTSSGGKKNQMLRKANTCIRWEPMEGGWASGALGLRIFREEKEHDSVFSRYQRNHARRKRQTKLSVKGRPCPPLKAHVILNASTLNAFMCLMSHPRITTYDVSSQETIFPESGQRASFRIVEQKDSNSDIIHIVCRPLYMFPSWTAPRDYCINRYWRLEDDGSYMVCYDSVVHADCPPKPPYVRGELNGIYTIAPLKRRVVSNNSQTECLMTHIVQVDPRGWIPTINVPYLGNQGYAEAFAVSSLLQMMDIKDALDLERFVSTSLDSSPSRSAHFFPQQSLNEIQNMQLTPTRSFNSIEDDMINYDFAFSGEVGSKEIETQVNQKCSVSSCPAPLSTSMWAEPDANSFKVRGKLYKKDKKKYNAGKSMLRLFAVDLLRVQSVMMGGVANHPKERIQQALAKEAELKNRNSSDESDMPPYIFVLNITIPGTPLHHLIMYFAVDDMSTIDGTDGTPFSKLANQFFFGDSDEFRDHTFKLIPQIVEGNFIVRRAVGSTPAIMGTKLKQYYFRGERFFELMLDVGSSSVAAGVTGLAAGYAKNLVVDMAFVLEGNDESTLPEKVMGCCRAKYVDLVNGPRLCEPYKNDST